MAGVPGWQDFLSCYREHFEVVRASTPSLLDQVYRLRYQVYCVENDYEDAGRQAEGRETDIYDDRSVHALLIHRRSDAVAGTVRVILPGKDREPPLPVNLVADCNSVSGCGGCRIHVPLKYLGLRSRRNSGSAAPKQKIAGCFDTSPSGSFGARLRSAETRRSTTAVPSWSVP